MKRQLGPELYGITRGGFTETTPSANRKRQVAHGYETYDCRIEQEDSRIDDRGGVPI